MKQLSVTVVIPVKDEEGNLPRCLERLGHFQKVLVVDSGSSDETPGIATDAGAEFLNFEWDGNFPKKRNWVLRNYSFETEWVLFLDADEFVSDAFVEELSVKLKEADKVGYWLNYDRWFLGKQLKYGDEFQKLALFRIGAGEYEQIEEANWSSLDMEIHEHPILQGELGEIESLIEHNEYRGMRHYIAKHNEYSSWEASRYLQLIGSGGCALSSAEWNGLTDRQRKKYQNLTKWWAAPVYFLRGYFWKRGFLDGAVGFHFALLKSIYFYQIRLKIKEKQATQS